MASVYRDSGKVIVAFTHPFSGKRPKIHLGKISDDYAADFKLRLESIIAALKHGLDLEEESNNWLLSLSPWVYDKLVAAGLVIGRQWPTAARRIAPKLSNDVASGVSGNPVAPEAMNPTQAEVWKCLAEGVLSIDALVQKLGISVPQISTALLSMEMRKLVRRLPGNRFERQ